MLVYTDYALCTYAALVLDAVPSEPYSMYMFQIKR